MPAIVYTARISYGGSDRIDVTRKGGSQFGPSWWLLGLYLDKRKAGTVTDAEWDDYADRYTEEMRDLYRRKPSAFDRLLAPAEITLVCYCTDATQCHRTLLAEILEKLGASYAGERSTS